MRKFIIFDGSSIFYRAFYAMPNLTAPSGVPTGGVIGFANIVMKLLRESDYEFAAVALDTSRKTFRTEIFPEYKATRSEVPDELIAQLELLREFTGVMGLKTLIAPNYEADDIIGTLSTQASTNFLVDIVTGDRDAFQLINPTTRVLYVKSGSNTVIYDETKFQSEYGFAPPKLVDYKSLCGDSSDNIPGVKGIGDKTAKKLVQDFGTLESVIEHSGEIVNRKVREAVKISVDVAKLSKTLAQIDCEVPAIHFSTDEFRIVPNLTLVDEFCNRYDMKVLKRRIHDLFDDSENLFGNLKPNDAKVLPAPEVAETIDLAKIIDAECLAVAVDFDTANNIKSAAVKLYGGEVFCVDKVTLSEIIGGVNCKIVVSDLKRILHSVEIDDVSKFFDVALAAYLLYPERDNYSCAELLSLEFGGLRLADETPVAQTAALEMLGDIYAKKLDDSELTKLYSDMELPLTRVLAKMELRGVYVDNERLGEKSAEMQQRIAEIEKEIYSYADESFNINSSKQLAAILFDKLQLPVITNTRKKAKSGVSTNAEVLEALKDYHPIVQAILKFRALTKLKSTYLDGIKNLISRADNRIHTNFNQTVTATGRLSSSDPNLQNIPVRTEEGRQIRTLFEPGNGYDCLLSADYSQIELRLLAHMSGDENMIDAFRSNQDIHARTAAEVFGIPIGEVTPELRRRAKAVNFGIVYGISEYGLSLDLHISRKEAGEYIQLYFNRYPKVKEFSDATIKQAHELGYVTTMFGRRRFLPAIKSPNFHQRGLSERMAINTPIQGSAADIIKLAMIRAENNLRGFKSRLILQVHDELVIEAVDAEIGQVEKIIRDAMENVVTLKIPLSVDIHRGKNWADAK